MRFLPFLRARDQAHLGCFVAFALVGWASLRPSTAAPAAELVVRHANVITMDTNRARAAAFAVANGKFVAVGSDAEITPFIASATRILDLAGKTIVPGFNDAHLHPAPVYPEETPWAAVDCTPQKVRTMDELIAALKRKAERTPVQRISVEEALRAWTLGSAFAEFAEQHKGSISKGKFADFVVLAADPTGVRPETIKDITIEKTFIGGRPVFEVN